MNLSDGYTLMYSYVVQHVIEKFGEAGERAMREGTRHYGEDRAKTLRQKHIDVGAKVNMQNLFSLYPDLPGDPRFRREKQELNQQERISHTLICPMADIWALHGQKAIGRIYCEEFHSACYGCYGYGYTHVNLAKTLTQDGDEYCSFSVILRPENLPQELRVQCFEEYDPEYVKHDFPKKNVSGKDGFNLLTVKLYSYLLDSAVNQLGEEGGKAVEEGLTLFARVFAQHLKESAAEYNLKIDQNFVENNFPLVFDIDKEELWNCYGGHNAKGRMKEHFYKIFHAELGV